MAGIHPESFVAPGALLLGEVELQEHSSIWFGTILRADLAPICVGRGSNIQDGAVIHVAAGHPTHIGQGVTVGHRAVVHGCTVEEGVLVGIGAIILDGARVGSESIVGAGAVVPPQMEIPPRSLALGVPARIVRSVSAREVEGNREQARRYVELWQTRYRQSGQDGSRLPTI